MAKRTDASRKSGKAATDTAHATASDAHMECSRKFVTADRDLVIRFADRQQAPIQWSR